MSAHEILAELGAAANDRRQLQLLGWRLEEQTSGIWLLTEFQNRLQKAGASSAVLDSLRTANQARVFKESFPDAIHIHLTADPGELRTRFLGAREGLNLEADDARQLLEHPVETGVAGLKTLADLVLDTSDRTPSDVCDEVLRALDR